MNYDIAEFYIKHVDEFVALRIKFEALFSDLAVVHTVKGRVKKYESLCAKLKRKKLQVNSEADIRQRITDMVGIRLLYLMGENFGVIHEYIMGLVSKGILELQETPQAYTYDSEYEDMYTELGIKVKTKASKYTSVHYVVKLVGVSDYCCEIQVRSLFEEAWGEIEHLVNYPNQNSNPVCRRELKSLARLVQKSNKLVNSIMTQAKLGAAE